MIGKIKVMPEDFPGKEETFIYFIFKDDFKKNPAFKILNERTRGKLAEKLETHNFTGQEGQIISFELFDFYQNIIVIGAGEKKDFSLAKWKNSLAEGMRLAQSLKSQAVTTNYFENLGQDFFEIGKNLSLVLYLTNYYFDVYKSEEEKKKIHRIKELRFQIKNFKQAITDLQKGTAFGQLLAEGVYCARDLVNQPASHLHPETLVEEAFKIEKESKGKIKVEVLDEEECRRLGMGGFLGVAQGSDRKPKFIILSLKSKVENQKSKKICLIGKSITFDSGGLSLKPAEAMETMKMDMAGGAAVLGVFKILAKLDSRLHGFSVSSDIYGLLPACENMPSGKALRPGDVLTALNGKTIEVLNTDAEGRLTLADALVYGEKYLKSEVIIDLATLTGACMVALGREISGMFSNSDKLVSLFKEVAKKEGEELWHLPLHKPYLKQMKSEVADIKNVGGGRYGGAITAALFLSEFVEKADWVHFDIAGPAFNTEEAKGVITKGGTGWGVVSLMELIKKMNF